MKVSVIIAAFNAQHYLKETLDSIKEQSIDDLEVILVDDGSTDDTLKIAREYARQYSALKVLSQKNSGPAAARNLGMQKAKGDYLFFLDADDLLAKDALLKLYERAKEMDADLVIGKYDIFNEYTHYPVTNLDNLVKEDFIFKYDTRILWTFTLWNKLFRHSTIRENGLSFPDLSYSEDGVFTMNMVFHSERITGLNEIVLHYRRDYHPDSTSITATVKPWKIDHFSQAHILLKEAAVASIERDYPQAKQTAPAIKDFIHMFEIKEVQTLINQFYAHFWQMDEECRKLTIGKLGNYMKTISPAAKADLMDRNPELKLDKGNFSYESLLDSAQITLILDGQPENALAFQKTLVSLLTSNYVSFVIYVPACMRPYIHLEEREMNLFYIEETDSISFYQAALAKTYTEYVMFACDSYLYSFSFLSKLLPVIKECAYDYVSEFIYHIVDQERRILPSCRFYHQQYIAGRHATGLHYLDAGLANKIFRREYLLSLLKQTKSSSPFGETFLQQLTKGYYGLFDHGTILYTGSQDDYFLEIEKLHDMAIDDSKKTIITAEQIAHLLKQEKERAAVKKAEKTTVKYRLVQKARRTFNV